MLKKQAPTIEYKTASNSSCEVPEDFLYNIYQKKGSSLKLYYLPDMAKKQKWELCM